MSAPINWDYLLSQRPDFKTLYDLFIYLRNLYWDCETIALLLGVSPTALYHKMKEVGVPFAPRGSKICPECKKRHAACTPIKVRRKYTVRVVRFK